MSKFILSNGGFVWSKKAGNGFATMTPPPPPNYLCFTAEEANSTVELIRVGSPSIANTAYSKNGTDWTTFTPSTTAGWVPENVITLANVGDKVYFRNDITRDFGEWSYLNFKMSGKIAASGNINSMYIHKDFENLTTLIYNYCYTSMFKNCTSLTTTPELPATTLADYCYYSMFENCPSLTTIPALPAATLKTGCYNTMFSSCSKIKMAKTSGRTEYPNTYTFGATPSSVYAANMFLSTGGLFTGTPTQQTLYTANTIV